MCVASSKKLLAVVLAVDIDEMGRRGAQQRRRRGTAVYPAHAAPIGGDLPLDEQAAVLVRCDAERRKRGERRLRQVAQQRRHRRAGRARAHQIAARARAQHRADRIDHDRLARAGLAR